MAVDAFISLHPRYVEAIAAGTKTVELRRRFSKAVGPGSKLFVYETLPTKALVGIAYVADVYEGRPTAIWRKFSKVVGISKRVFDEYFLDASTGFAIQISEFRSLRKAVDLSVLRQQYAITPPQSFALVGRGHPISRYARSAYIN